MRLLFLLLANLAIFCATTFAYEFDEEDTIVIEAGDANDWGRLARAAEFPTTTEIPEIKSGECITTGGKEGKCSKFRECYPSLVPVAARDSLEPEDTYYAEAGTFNQALAEILVNISGLCEGDSVRSYDETKDFSSVLRSEVMICCATSPNTPPPLPTQPKPSETITPEQIERSGCGQLKIDLVPDNTTRIVNGREAQKGEFPWIVALMNNGREFCGGSLINSQYVLTAAHCIQHMTQSDVARLTVQLGDHNIYSTTDGTHEVRKASKVLYNKGFSMNHLHHDIALLKLSSPVTFSTHIQPVCLHSGSPPYDGGSTKADVAGWGQLSDGGSQPTTLRTVNIRAWKHADCKAKYAGKAPSGVGEGMVCAGGDGNGGDSCRGDSGGPLTVDTKSTAKQIGIVSWGIGCGSYPGVYTRVDKYTSWINKNSKN